MQNYSDINTQPELGHFVKSPKLRLNGWFPYDFLSFFFLNMFFLLCKLEGAWAGALHIWPDSFPEKLFVPPATSARIIHSNAIFCPHNFGPFLHEYSFPENLYASPNKPVWDKFYIQIIKLQPTSSDLYFLPKTKPCESKTNLQVHICIDSTTFIVKQALPTHRNMFAFKAELNKHIENEHLCIHWSLRVIT